MGSYVSTINDSGAKIYIKYGPNDILKGFVFIGTLIPELIGLGIIPIPDLNELIYNGIDKEFKEHGLSGIGDGGEYRSEKLTLSLLIQANLIKVWSDGNTFYAQTGTIDCISGPTDGSTNTYHVSGNTRWGETQSWALGSQPEQFTQAFASVPGMVDVQSRAMAVAKEISASA